MRAFFTSHFQRSYHKLPQRVQVAFDKQLTLLLSNSRHPSLRVKKYDEQRDLWQVRVTGNYRCYFAIRDKRYIFHDIRAHSD